MIRIQKPLSCSGKHCCVHWLLTHKTLLYKSPSLNAKRPYQNLCLEGISDNLPKDYFWGEFQRVTKLGLGRLFSDQLCSLLLVLGGMYYLRLHTILGYSTMRKKYNSTIGLNVLSVPFKILII